jgi:hypothetical protein
MRPASCSAGDSRTSSCDGEGPAHTDSGGSRDPHVTEPVPRSAARCPPSESAATTGFRDPANRLEGALTRAGSQAQSKFAGGLEWPGHCGRCPAMNAPSLRLPAPVAGDSIAVKDALEAAHTFWQRGDRRQAIACVRLAVEVADEAGDAARVAALARAVADLGTASTPPPLPPPSRRLRPVSTVPPPPISGALPTTSTLPPPPTLPSRPVPRPGVMPLPPSSQSPESAHPTSDLRRRVSVKVSVRDPNLLVVRPLAEGESAPAGTREAFLVMADPLDGTAAGSSRG